MKGFPGVHDRSAAVVEKSEHLAGNSVPLVLIFFSGGNGDSGDIPITAGFELSPDGTVETGTPGTIRSAK